MLWHKEGRYAPPQWAPGLRTCWVAYRLSDEVWMKYELNGRVTDRSAFHMMGVEVKGAGTGRNKKRICDKGEKRGGAQTGGVRSLGGMTSSSGKLATLHPYRETRQVSDADAGLRRHLPRRQTGSDGHLYPLEGERGRDSSFIDDNSHSGNCSQNLQRPRCHFVAQRRRQHEVPEQDSLRRSPVCRHGDSVKPSKRAAA
ncbi:hypothetical protein SODALDRAFT_62108 [Sodiomyces alkalinus F11]|uniref:Uncharacterized protein n=1 Tax=Sodiomyces alkalinus (strain CBS 110278 / VKM F-3762 / F11) TaxID=1314773 RepID=A0A3N2PLN6_SODAK|nr:hypothetical protein SODALDRAFT_62108 [Sodiomyces alkalinus F11]ROT35330.1 hypothetical protein SODALDRAFT_62108 [Sodiomyces alkalinus F11]